MSDYSPQGWLGTIDNQKIRIAQLEILCDQLAELVKDLYDDGECDLDHHGYCQAHLWFNSDSDCPHPRAIVALSSYQTDKERYHI